MSKIVTIDLDAPIFDFFKAGVITALHRKGNPPAIYFQYYNCFHEHVLQGNNRTTAANLAADDCGVDVRTIQRAIKAIEVF